MPRKQPKPPDFIEIMRKITHAGISKSPIPNRQPANIDKLPTLEERVSLIMGIANASKQQDGYMLFFVMYDIESNKVRTQVVKYLQRKGCTRVQKSIFLANLPNSVYNEIRTDLTEVQAAYENNDSILVVPVSTDMLRSMKIIGQNIEIDVITHSKNSLFF